MSNGKIGIGPAGPLAGLIQLILVTAIGIVVFVYFMSAKTILLTILPITLLMLVALGHLALLGDNYPFMPPGGKWTPEKPREVGGVGMTIIWAIFTAVIVLFMRYVWPKWPISPLYLWFGVIAFWLTLLYGTNWNGWPFKGKLPPWGTMAAGFIIIMGLSILIWTFLTNLNGTPLAKTPLNQNGPINVEWLTGFLVWCIAWYFVFNPVFITQGWPFGKLGHPGAAVAQTILAHVLGFIFWQGSLALKISPTLSFGAVGSSVIFWSLVYSWHLQFWGITKLTLFKRALAAFIVLCVIVPIWIIVLQFVLGPAAKGFVAAKLPGDVNLLIIYVNLCIVGPAMIAHNAFWLRWPLTLPTPPGTPPPDQAA